MDSVEKWGSFFRIIGLGSMHNSRWRRVIFGIQNLCLIVNFLLLLMFYRYIYLYQDAMGTINDVVKYSATLSATGLILIESLWKEHQLWQLSEVVHEFQQDIGCFVRRKHLEQWNLKFWKSFKIRFFIFTAFYLASELSLFPIYLSNSFYHSSTFFLMGTNLFIYICRYRHWQHVLFMDLAHFQLELLKKVLRGGIASNAKLRRLQELFGNTAQMVKLQNSFFGVSQSMNLIFNHVQLLGDAYWTYWRYLNGCCTPGSFSKHTGDRKCGSPNGIKDCSFSGIFFAMINTVCLLVLICSSSVKCIHIVPYITYWLHRVDSRR